MTIYYPIFLNLEGKPCLVVGGGEVAVRKAAALIQCGAKVKVVAPEVSPQMERFVALGKVSVERRGYENGDLKGIFLVIAATDNPEVNHRVSQDARNLGIPVNVADSVEASDFIVPSTMRRGELVIAISTSGHSPALARWIREDLEKRYGQEYARLVDLISKVRQRLLSEGGHPPTRHGASPLTRNSWN